jgi:chorismate mutase
VVVIIVQGVEFGREIIRLREINMPVIYFNQARLAMRKFMAKKKNKKDLISTDEINPNQEVFCEVYAGGGDFFGNGTRAYIIAYKLDIPADVEYGALNSDQRKIYDSASAMSAALLRNVKIQRKCNELIDRLIETSVVDRELAYTIMQRGELSPKVSAIKEYNQLKGRITTISEQRSLNVNINQNIPDEQVDRLAEELIKRLKDGEPNNNKGTDNTKS